MTSSSPPPPRRFRPEPIESTTTKKVRRFAAEPVETTTKSIRKFASQPIESSTRHSGEESDHKVEPADGQSTQITNDVDPKPRRKFAPQPVETTSKSSRATAQSQKEEIAAAKQQVHAQPEASTTKRRRFAPEPVEVTSKSNRRKDIDGTDEANAGISTSKETSNASNDVTKPVRRRFAPEPVESSSKSSRNSRSNENQESDSTSDDEPAPMLAHEMSLGPPSGNKERPKRKFLPQPVESSTRSTRSNQPQDSSSNSSSSEEGNSAPLLPHETTLGPPLPAKPVRRKFAPQLIETAKRSRKSGDDGPGVLPADKTNVTPSATPPTTSGTASPRLHVTISDPERSREGSPLRLTSRTEELELHRQNSRARSRQHSFKVPTLPDIDSSESEEESRSNSRSQSHYGDSDTSDEMYKDATRMRESVDGRFSGYLLSLAARAADKQLRDQAAAAFPNSDVHEPVAHYVDRSDSEEDIPDPPVMRSGRPDPTRRDSGDEKWALREMQQHAEHVGKQERGRKKSVTFKADRRGSKGHDWGKTAGGPFASAESKPRKMIGGHQRDPDLKQMRKAASPPMLGAEIEFPRCASPENARFDVTQGADFLRKQMCYLTEQTTQDKNGLWAKGDEKSKDPMARVVTKPTVAGSEVWGASTSGTQSPAKGARPGGGLWGGFCTGQDSKPIALPSGLQTPLRTPSHTPSREKEDPFLSIMASNSNAPALPSHRSVLAVASSGQRTPRVPSSPPPNTTTKLNAQQQQFAAAVDARFALEAKIDAEFNDVFVTQVYNYLSLGYPSLARKFDEELSRISRVPVEELRTDDKVSTARGHVKVPGDDDGDWDQSERDRGRGKGDDVTECRRWKALKRYVREWGRQMGRREKEAEEKGVDVVDSSRAWGLPIRKGSWGL